MKIGDRVKRSDAENHVSIPSYRDMRGEVEGFTNVRGVDYIVVMWDYDLECAEPTPTLQRPEWITLADD